MIRGMKDLGCLITLDKLNVNELSWLVPFGNSLISDQDILRATMGAGHVIGVVAVRGR